VQRQLREVIREHQVAVRVGQHHDRVVHVGAKHPRADLPIFGGQPGQPRRQEAQRDHVAGGDLQARTRLRLSSRITARTSFSFRSTSSAVSQNRRPAAVNEGGSRSGRRGAGS
jgi:hypothetical protein